MKILPRNEKIRALLLCILGGSLLAFSFPPFKSWFLVYFGLMILLYQILSADRFRTAFIRPYVTFLIFNEIALYWISGWHSDDTFLKIGGITTVLIHSLFMMIPVLITYGVSRIRKTLALVLFPFIWVGYEYFDNLWQFAFPWLELGNTETYNIERIQYIEFTGVHGISFLICVIAVLLFTLTAKVASKQWKLTSPISVVSYVLLLILILLPNFYSAGRLSEDNTRYFNLNDSTKVVNACIVQSNTDPFKKWGGDHETLLNSYMDGLYNGLKFDPDLLILHETATPYYFLEDYNMLKSRRFFDFVDSTGKYLVMGIPHLEYYKDSLEARVDSRKSSSTGRYYDVFNSAIMIEPGKHHKYLTIHKKVKLVPFSERIPYQEKVPFAKKWLTWGVGISGWQLGNEQTIFTLKDEKKNIDTRFAALICYESVFSRFVSDFTDKGAEFFVVVTNDGWWGNTSGPEQHNQYAVFRSIENRKWIIRCAQTGVSCFIDPLGNKHDQLEYGTVGVTDKNIIANTEKTYFAENGDIIGVIGFCIGLLSLAASAGFYVYRKKVKSKA